MQMLRGRGGQGVAEVLSPLPGVSPVPVARPAARSASADDVGTAARVAIPVPARQRSVISNQ
jgi:hypothetical protein